MSQPLSGVTGTKIPIKNEKRNYMSVQKSQARTIELRQAVCLLLLIAGLVLVPVGAAVLWGAGGALITAGVLCVALGVILGVF